MTIKDETQNSFIMDLIPQTEGLINNRVFLGLKTQKLWIDDAEVEYARFASTVGDDVCFGMEKVEGNLWKSLHCNNGFWVVCETYEGSEEVRMRKPRLPAELWEDLHKDDDTCSVCLEDLTQEDRAATSPCHHNFHLECIKKWRADHGECPICRAKIDHMIYDVKTPTDYKLAYN